MSYLWPVPFRHFSLINIVCFAISWVAFGSNNASYSRNNGEFMIKDISLIFSIISSIFITIGVVIAFFEWFSEKKNKRVDYLGEIVKTIYFDKELSKAMYIIEYGHKWYNEDFHESKIEHSIDKLFSYFNYICYLRESKSITKKEFLTIKYLITRIFKSPSTKHYLWNIYHFSNVNNTKCSFEYLITYGMNNKYRSEDNNNIIIKDEFEDCYNENKKYKKYLKFCKECQYSFPATMKGKCSKFQRSKAA